MKLLSGPTLNLGGKLLIGNIGKAKITGIAEVAVYNWNIVDSALSDSSDATPRFPILSPSKLRIYTPKTGINIQIPVTSLFAVEMNNTFERRIATKPKTLTHWIWSPQILARTVPLTQLNLSPYIYYESFDNKDERYMASFSFGINCEPITDLMLNLGDKVYWNPEPKEELTHQRIHQIYFSLGYTFDLTK